MPTGGPSTIVTSCDGHEHGVYGRGAGRFGHPGAGGSLAFADPDLGLGFAFVPSDGHPGALPGPRSRSLVAALDEPLAIR